MRRIIERCLIMEKQIRPFVDRGGTTFIESGPGDSVALSGSSIISQKRHPSNDAAYITRLATRGGETLNMQRTVNFSPLRVTVSFVSPGLPWPVPLHLAACDHSLG